MHLVHQLDPENWPEAYSEYLLGFAINRLRDRDQAEDMVQETFLKALKKIHLFKGASSELTWLTAILKNNIYDLLRRESKMDRLEDVENSNGIDDDSFEENGRWKAEARPGAWHTDKMDNLERKELYAVFGKCMNDLPEQWSAVFSMKHLDEEKSETICKELQLTASNLWTIMHRAKLKLRSCMEKFWLK
jgi:RNA polymerase sigma-70 factor (TIGR02943 family)